MVDHTQMGKNEAHTSDVVRHLYVHFPFCARICPYCAFYKTRGNAAEVGRFCQALVCELQGAAPLSPSTIYFGGGTPTAPKISQLEVILSAFHQLFDLSELREWTIEANPGASLRVRLRCSRNLASIASVSVSRVGTTICLTCWVA